MDSQGSQSAFIEGQQTEGSFDMSTDFRTLAAEMGGSLNTATDALLGAFEPLRTHSETEQLLAPLDDILKDIYDIRSSFTTTPTTAPPSYSTVPNANQGFYPNFTSPTHNASSYGNFMNSEVSFEAPRSSYGTNYMPSVGQNFIPSPAVQVPMPGSMQCNQLVSLPDEENVQGPVYLDFNIGTMPPQMVSFQKYQQAAPAPTDAENGYQENNFRYMEYLNESGETARTRFFDNNAKGYRDYRTHRQNTMNAMNKFQFDQPNEGCNKYGYAADTNFQTVERNESQIQEENKVFIAQNPCEIFKETAVEGDGSVPKPQIITYAEEPEILVCRPPFRTKRTARENSQISVQFNDGGDNDAIQNVINLGYITVIDNSDVQIPTIQYRSTVGRMKRKQELKIRKWEDEVSFEEPNLAKNELNGVSFHNTKSSPVCRTPKRAKPLSEEMFLGKRKRKNSSPPSTSLNGKSNEESDFRPFSEDPTSGRRKFRTNTPTARDTYRTRNSERMRRLVDCGSSHTSSAAVIASSDSDLEDITVLSSKSLKCPKCKKIFKTPRSLAIHQKRCSVLAETDSDLEITMVEYLESEKELDGTMDEVSFVETSEGTTTVTVIEKVNEVDDDKTEKVKEKQHTNEEVQENPLRRNTRSLTNLIASKKLGQSNETKPGSSQTNSKTASSKGVTNSARSTRRRKTK